jgi:hypothetical protein
MQDDAATALRNVTTKLKDVEEQNNRMEQQLQQLSKRLVDTEEGKSDVVFVSSSTFYTRNTVYVPIRFRSSFINKMKRNEKHSIKCVWNMGVYNMQILRIIKSPLGYF